MVLWGLFAGPKHVYGLQKLFESQGKDRVVNLRSRASLYQALERLMRMGLVEVHETVRREGYPERVVYAITDAGRTAARDWLRDMLSATGGEFPDFIAALSILFGLAPAEAQAQLELRAERLSAQLADTEHELSAHPQLPRLFLLEEEYRRSVLQAEIDWLHAVVDELRTGRLTWSEQWLAEMFSAFNPDAAQDDEEDS